MPKYMTKEQIAEYEYLTKEKANIRKAEVRQALFSTYTVEFVGSSGMLILLICFARSLKSNPLITLSKTFS